MLAETRAGVTLDWADADGIRTFLAEAWKQHLSGGVPATSGEIGPYSRRATAHALAQLLESVAIVPKNGTTEAKKTLKCR